VSISVVFNSWCFTVFVCVDGSDDEFERDFPEEVRSKYVVSRKLGAGSFGVVYLVFDKVCIQIEK